MRFERKAVLAALRRQVEQGRAILAAAAGNGLVARVEDRGDTDLIIVYNSGRYRMDGIASIAGNLPIGDANAIVRDMGRRQILHMVQDTPVVAGIYGVDPTRDMRAFLEELKEIGYSGVINFPTVGKLSGRIRQELEQAGMGFAKEVERLRMAAELGFFTMAYCYCPQEGVSQASPLEQAIEDTSAILSAALERRPDILPLCHGGAIVTPEDVQQVVRRTPAVGFVAASSIERLPVEGAVGQMVQALKGVVL